MLLKVPQESNDLTADNLQLLQQVDYHIIHPDVMPIGKLQRVNHCAHHSVTVAENDNLYSLYQVGG